LRQLPYPSQCTIKNSLLGDNTSKEHRNIRVIF
jgi:hypothetical protein